MNAGDLDTALERSRVAVELSAEGSDLDRGSSHGIRGLVLWALGDLERARATWATSLDALERAGHLADVLGGSIAVGDILIALGRLDEAEATYRRGLELGRSTEPALRGTADMHVGLSDLLRERGDLAAARAELDAAESLGEYAGLPQNRHRRRMAAARLLQAEGDPAAGIPLLDEAESLYTPDFFPDVRPIGAMRIRLQVAAGRLEDARAGVRRRGVAAEGDLSFLSEYDHITLARVLLAEAGAQDAAAASALLDRLLEAAELGDRRSAVIELLVLRSRAAHRAGDRAGAASALERAVESAESEGHVRVFLDEGEEVARLLAMLPERDDGSRHLRRLRAAAGTAGRPRSTAGALRDPLSERELEVLRLLASDLSGPDISRHLVVSLNTLRTHTKNIYAKLGATSRLGAVSRARELGLLNSPR
jgi:LuxR family maltose regulon positive regulatory protein